MRELALVAAGAAVGGLISLAVARASRRSEAAGRTLRGKVSRVRRVGAKLAFVELKGGSQLKIAHQHLDSGQRVPKKKEVCLGDELEATVLAHSAAGEGPALVRAWRITDKSGAREERKQAAAAKRAKRDRDKQRCRELNRDTARPGADTAAHAAAPGSGEPPARLRRCEAVLARRTSRLMLVLERANDEFNHTAVLRTAECLGIQHVWIVDPVEMKRKSTSVRISRGAEKWLSVRHFPTPESCIEALRAEGWTIWATDLSQRAVSLEDDSLTVPERIAVVVGREADGVSAAMREAADACVYFLLHGWSDSLNVSVATACVATRLFWLDPSLRGAMGESERGALRKEWYQRLARTAEQKRLFPRFLESPPPSADDCRKTDEQRIPRVERRIQRRTAEQEEARAREWAERNG